MNSTYDGRRPEPPYPTPSEVADEAEPTITISAARRAVEQYAARCAEKRWHMTCDELIAELERAAGEGRQ